MSKPTKRIAIHDLPESSTADVTPGDIQPTPATDIRGGGRYSIRMGDRIGKRAVRRTGVRSLRDIRKISGIGGNNSWMLK